MIIDNPKISGSLEVQNHISASDGTITGNLIVQGNVVGTASTASYVESANVDGLTNLSSSIASGLLKNTTDTLTGDLTVTGNITAQEFHTEYVSASVIYESGSTQFGNTLDDTHNFTGSINLTGSLNVNGAEVGTGKLDETVFNAYTSSADTSFNSYTSSTDTSIQNLTNETSSYALKAEISGSNTTLSSSVASDIEDILDGTDTVTSASYALTASYADSGAGFPFDGAAIITGSLYVSGSTISGSFVGDGSQLTDIVVSQVSTVTSSFSAVSTLTINHNFNSKNVSVAVYNSSDVQVLPAAVTLTDNDNVKIDFAGNTAGYAVVSKGGHIVSGSLSISETGHISDSFTSQTSHTVFHGFNTKEVIVSVYEGDNLIIPDSVTTNNLDSITVSFPEAISGRVVVVKGGHLISGSVLYSNITNKPTLLSGSAQIASDISGSFISLSSSLESRVSDQENFSSSLDATFATDADLNLVSSSVDSLNAATSSYALANQISGSFTSLSSSIASELLKNTTDTLTGDLTVTGTLTAQDLHVQEVTSSILYSSGSNILGASSSDTQTLYGNVGIGTNSPYSNVELDVYGDISLAQQNWALRGNNSNADLVLEELNGSTLSDSNIKIQFKSGGDLFLTKDWTPGNASRLVVRGEGTYNNTFSRPGATLQVISDELSNDTWSPVVNIAVVRQSLTTGRDSFGGIGFSSIDDSNNSGQYDAGRIALINESPASVVTPTALAFYTNVGTATTGSATEQMRINSSGNLGIGTTTPRVQTEIYGTGQLTSAISDSGYSGATLSLSSNQNLANAGGCLLFGALNDSGNTKPQASIKSLLQNGGLQGIGDLAFSTRAATSDTVLTERMRITSGGNSFFNYTNQTIETYGSGAYGGKVVIKASGAEGLSLINSTIGGAAQVAMNFTNEFVANQYNWLARIIAEPEQSWSGTASTRSSRLTFFTNNAGTIGEKMRITGDGDISLNGGILGLGRASSTPTISYGMFHYSGIGLGIYSSAGGGTQGIGFWLNNGSAYEAGRWLQDGNLGIGTTSPSNKLEVFAPGNGDGIIIQSDPAGVNRAPALHLNPIAASANGRNWAIAPFRDVAQSLSFSSSNAKGGNAYAVATTRMIIDGISGNVGIGTTSPQMGLHVADTKGALFGPSGSGTASSYFSPSDENTLNGGYGIDTDSADIWLNYRGYQDGFTRFRDTRIGNGKGGLVAIFNGSSGNFGIGVTDPGFQAVDSYGQIGIEIKGAKESNQAPCLRLHETGSGKGSFELRSNRDAGTSGNYFAIAEGTDTFFAIRADDNSGGTSTRGYVGIGTVSPTQLLNVVNDTTGTWTAKFTNNTNHVYLSVNDANNYGIYVSGEAKNYFSGRVGIGTTAPNATLEIGTPSGVAGSAGSVNRLFISPFSNTGGPYKFIARTVSGASDFLDMYYGPNHIISYGLDGKVGIGTTSPAAKLQTNSATAGNVTGAYFTNSQANSGAEKVSIAFGLNRSGGDFIRSTQAITFGSEQQWTGTPSSVRGYLQFNTMQDESEGARMRISSEGLISSQNTITSHSRRRDYTYTGNVANGVTVDLIENSSAYTDVTFILFMEIFHSGRTYRVIKGSFGGYGLNISSSGSGIGINQQVVATGRAKLRISNTTGYTAGVHIHAIIIGDPSITVHNGVLATAPQ